MITTGAAHTCALNSTGGVQCWGSNEYGQLGDGQSSNRGAPANVIGLSRGVSALATGSAHSCALTVAGGVKCWGDNSAGQLGNSTTLSANIPVDVTGLLSGVRGISAGANHTCAVTTAGGVKCWGANYAGQLGNGSTLNSNTPVDVIGLAAGISAVSAGNGYTCAVTSVGGVKCWGHNGYGELGNGSTVQSDTPVEVVGLAQGVRTIDAGNGAVCAVTIDGKAKCWGNNRYGQLGIADTGNISTPVDIVGLSSNINTASIGDEHICVLSMLGDIECWGNNRFGQLGNGDDHDSSTPVAVQGVMGKGNAISAGGYHTCALTTVGDVQCWGSNRVGQLGHGSVPDSRTPVEVSLKNQVSAIHAGADHTCSLLQDSRMQCWGDNGAGQLGNGSTRASNVPIDMSGFSATVSAIATGAFNTCILTTVGGVKCWGDNDSGQLGIGSTHNISIPTDVIGLSNGVSAISAGWRQSCALMTSGSVMCWGDNTFGQLGITDSFYVSTPMTMTELTNAVDAISSGGEHLCALMQTGGVKCWGANYLGQLGIGSTDDMERPTDVIGLQSDVVALSAGMFHTCVLTSSGGVKCWGANHAGQLGNGSTVNSPVPVDVEGMSSGIRALSAGVDHTCALTTGGSVKCWGANSLGQLGNVGSRGNDYSATPLVVLGLGGEAAAISVGGAHTCALMTTGSVKCWGANHAGQLGDGNAWYATPVNVQFSNPEIFLPMIILDSLIDENSALVYLVRFYSHLWQSRV
ncbi:MAG: hypothetical protein R3C14_55195 [Caldilineaceae bacterium]